MARRHQLARRQRPAGAPQPGQQRRKRPGGIGAGVKSQAQRVLRTGQRFDKFDQIRQRYFWSSYYFDTPTYGDYINAGTYTLFTTPVGSNGQGFPSGQVITDRESNWKSQNRIPDNQNFEVTELGCSVLSADFGTNQSADYLLRYPTPSAMANFFNSAVLSITYLTNSVPLGLLSDFAQAGGPAMGVAIAPIPGITVDATTLPSSQNMSFTNGFAAPALRRKFKIPILLQHGESFNFTIQVPRNTFVGDGLGAVSTAAPFLVRVDFYATESFVEKS
jgi:hypothetical protein